MLVASPMPHRNNTNSTFIIFVIVYVLHVRPLLRSSKQPFVNCNCLSISLAVCSSILTDIYKVIWDVSPKATSGRNVYHKWQTIYNCICFGVIWKPKRLKQFSTPEQWSGRANVITWLQSYVCLATWIVRRQQCFLKETRGPQFGYNLSDLFSALSSKILIPKRTVVAMAI